MWKKWWWKKWIIITQLNAERDRNENNGLLQETSEKENGNSFPNSFIQKKKKRNYNND